MRAKPLTESEKITMKCVWDIGDGARLSRIMTLANDKYGKEWKPQTVSTFLGKLVRKGFVEQYRDGRYFYYRILIDKHTYRTQMIRDDVEFWDDDSLEMYISELFDKKTFTAKERKQLKSLVAAAKD
ncbi:putative uncharacterized protein [Roseburia sp. CAG:380]|jgi:BlaI family penicillinase repressor|uniref:BlaI/MecI/CopY family transcriptional regulator n=1 Tax=Roseburia sp. AM59-24XD TaxID=2293138 RepID=UPI000339472B|nr:BlaI/MecI/CopY family transcriptional regulator [Roseburia sp. AM59-24XD]RHP83906.1 hypothetical protein DXA20_11660 [Roseburia sp. AM59-24XD]CDC95382.1 putative uncharacterized protein [Roseburia sp. CAG:380]HCS15249.1 hypothetical protein [Lachnospiraceae bacterium]